MNSQVADHFRAQVEKLAFEFWEERGCPSGSPEEDWFRAEQVLRHHFGPSFPDLLNSPAAFSLSSMSMGPVEQ